MNRKLPPLLLLCSACMAMFSFAVSFTILGPMLGGILSGYSLDLSNGGSMTSFQSVGSLTAIVLLGLLGSRISKARVLSGAFLLLGLMMCAIGAAPPFMLLLLFFLIMGIATGCIDTLSSALVASLPLENSSAALNILHAGYSLGAVVGPFATLLFDGGSTAWSTAYLVCGGIITAVALLLGIVSFWASKHLPSPVRVAGSALKSARISYFKDPNTYAAILTTFFLNASLFILAIWTPTYLESLGEATAMSSASIALLWGGITISRFFGARLSSRFSHMKMILLGLSWAAVLLSAGFLLATPLLLNLCIFLAGLGLGWVEPLLINLCCQNHKDVHELAASSIFLTMNLASLIFPWLTGLISALVNNLYWGMMLVPGFMLPAIFFSAFLVRRKACTVR